MQCMCLADTSWKQRIKRSEIVNKFLLAGDKCMREMHLKQPGFTYSACRPLPFELCLQK